MSAILSVLPSPVNRFLCKNPAMLLVPLLLSPSTDFLNLSESCQKKAVFIQRLNTSLHLPPLEVPSNGIEVNTERSRLHTNWHFTRTVYHWSLILRSFRAKPTLIEDDANGFVEALCQFPHLLRMRKNVIVSLGWLTGSTQSCWVGRERKLRNENNEQFTFSLLLSSLLSYALLCYFTGKTAAYKSCITL